MGSVAARREAPLAPPPHVSRSGPAPHVAAHRAPRSARSPAAAPCWTGEQPIGRCCRRSSGGRTRAPLASRNEQDCGRGAGMPSHGPSSPPSWPADHKRSPLARPGLKWGAHVGQPGKMERATHNGSPKPSCPVSEGEKDSGFSDGSSECLSAIEQTDTEDPASPLGPPGPAKPQRAKGRLLGGAFSGGLTPLYLIKDGILEQTLGVPPMAPFLAWSNQHPLENAHGSAAHLLLLQEPMAFLKPMLPSQKPSAKKTCFPTLGAYPRIAAHPGWQAEEAPRPVAEPSRHKWLYMGEAWVSPEAPTAKDSHEKLPAELSASPQTSALVCPEAAAQPTLSCAGLPPGGGRTAAKGGRMLRGHSLERQRRLHNTMEILRRSGLLGITLRTKELLRQNNRTQRELAQLREEAQLLCEAARSSDSRVWARLQDAIGRSAAPCPSSKGGGAQTHLGQQPNLAAQPTGPLLPSPVEFLSGSGAALGPDTPLPVALP